MVAWLIIGLVAFMLVMAVFAVLIYRAEEETHKTRLWLIKEEANTRRMIAENRAAMWRELESLERQGRLTPTVKYRMLKWLTESERR